MEHILAGLNPKQQEAVRATQGPVLVISGPGSGKTRALTHRIAYLIASGIKPERILAVTFTNKAAKEIKDRVAKLLGRSVTGSPVLGTFHSIGVRILRSEIGKLGYDKHFSIMDTSDQLALIRRISAQMGLDIRRHTPGSLLHAVSKLKTDLVWPESYRPNGPREKTVAAVYRAYQEELQRLNGVDFDDLIGLPVKLFRKYPDILERYQNHWHHILVDEYQDTSHDQYVLIGMLAAKRRNLFCIGDDAQSIYMFREADIRNILNFQKDYPEGRVILLEQNYRSTKTILAAAQAVIGNNSAQIPKELWTANQDGEPIVLAETVSERDEARWVLDRIGQLQKERYSLSDCTVLYRTHAQSRALEEALMSAGMPYRIVGGIRFYERREIKDMLAYLRLLRNPGDYLSLERIYNVPARGIGATTFEKIAASRSGDMIAAIGTLAKQEGVTRAGKALSQFHGLLTELRDGAATMKLTDLLKSVVRKTEYERYLERKAGDTSESAEERIENVRELGTVAAKFNAQGPDGLGAFLEEVALLQDTDKLAEGERAVTLMTMHASKGLEFPVVFMVGMEEGLFPHSRTIWAPHELEEERRLCYVAVTRAKERLLISYARWRSIFGSRHASMPSRFIGEIPQTLLTAERSENLSWADEDADEVIDY